MDKQSATRVVSVTTPAGLGSKTITAVNVVQHGSVTGIEVVEGSTSHWIKSRQGLLEVGGDINWGSGTIQ
jgi:hypothetical protein